MTTEDLISLVERAEAAGVIGELEAEFGFELEAIAAGDEGLVSDSRLEELGEAAQSLIAGISL